MSEAKPANGVEFIPAEDGLSVAVTKSDGEVGIQHMTWEDFERLRKALDKAEGAQ